MSAAAKLDIHVIDLVRSARDSIEDGNLEYAAIDLRDLATEMERAGYSAETRAHVAEMQRSLKAARTALGTVAVGLGGLAYEVAS